MRILVTGATGFIGKRLIERLLANGHQVVGTGRSVSKEILANYTFIAADLLDRSQCDQLTEDIDVVIHCAGKAGVWGTIEDYTQANVVTTHNVVKAAQKNNVKRFINISSPSIYFAFKDQIGLKETDHPDRFSNYYALTKFQGEQIVQSAHSVNFLTVSLRPRGVIGAGDTSWLPRIIDMQKNNRLIQPGRGENLVDFTCVENLLDAIKLCLTTDEKNMGEVYNISNGEPQKLWTVIEESLKLVGLSSRHKKVFLPMAMLVAYASEVFHKIKKTKEEPSLLPIKVAIAAYSMTLDISKAKARLGYKPRQSTQEGLLEFSQWYMNQP